MQNIPNSIVFNEDCMAVMARYPNKYFDLAIPDPPYGIGESGGRIRTRKKHKQIVKHTKKQWDTETPNENYFKELKRVSKNQIIFGANYFPQYLTPSMGWIFWDKKIGGDFSDGEFVYTSFNCAAKLVSIWCETGGGATKRIHPVQKPIKLYDWIFKNYATEGMKILDTHLGSGSSRIAAYKAKMDFVGCELDKEYFEAAEKRFRDFTAQLTIF